MTRTKFSDYSLRLLLYLGLHDDRLVPLGEISGAYQVSPHIMVKVVPLGQPARCGRAATSDRQHGPCDGPGRKKRGESL